MRGLVLILLIGFLGNTFSKELPKQDIKDSFNYAEWYMLEGDYENARKLYNELVEFDSNNSNYNYKLGVAILLDIENQNEELAEKCLAIAIKNTSVNYKNNYKETSAPIDAFIYYAEIQMYKYNFDIAIQYFQNYLDVIKNKKTEFSDYAKREIIHCNTAKKLLTPDKQTKKVELGPKIMSKTKNKSFPLISIDQTVSIFAYGKNNESFGNLNFEINNPEYKTDDIYFSQKINGVWSDTVNITKELKLKKQVFPACLSADGETLYIVQDDNDNGNIYQSQFIDGKWTSIKKLNKNVNSKSWETHATITPDGRTLYFTSDRKGGFGGFDIYYSKLQSDGQWGPAVNLGNTINTEFDEDLPFIAKDNMSLFFCSQGHENIGGFDVFEAEITNGVFNTPENIGFVLNTPRNDFFYIASEGNEMKFSKLAKEETVVLEDIPLPDLTAENKQTENDSLNNATTLEDTTMLSSTFETVYTSNRKNSNNNNINNNYDKVLLFDFDKFILNKYDEKYVIDLAKKIDQNSKIEIEAFTDKIGDEKYNYRLSKKRAESVKKIFVDNGIMETNIKIIPMGESSVYKSLRLNRRAEIKIITK